jgi:DNA-binding transcriptional regulator YhcF (GntR family)
MVANFDGPSREECIANRVNSNTPQQALTLLNDPSMVEAARVMATSILNERVAKRTAELSKNSDSLRIELAMRRTLARDASDEEIVELVAFLNQQRKHYSADSESAAQLTSIGITEPERSIPVGELAAWTALCRVMLNLHETITRY